MMSLREFAKLAGVSVATASRVFSGKTRVAPKTRERILLLAERSGFHPSAIGQVAFGGKTRSIGVLTGNIEIDYFAAITTGIQDRLIKDDFIPITLQKFTAGAKLSDRGGLQKLLNYRVDGVIMCITDERLSREDFLPVLQNHLPIVLLGNYYGGWICDMVHTDDMRGGEIAGEHLIQLGHSHIGYTVFGEGHSSCDLRIEGFRRSLEKSGVSFQKELCARNPAHMERENREAVFRKSIRFLLTRKDRPTAIFATTDIHASLVIDEARKLGIEVPNQLSVIGFANLALAHHTSPPLTTIRQDGYAVGSKAAELVLRRINDPDAPVVTHLVPTTLIRRDSTAPFSQ